MTTMLPAAAASLSDGPIWAEGAAGVISDSLTDRSPSALRT
jgi:hypothetical protein